MDNRAFVFMNFIRKKRKRQENESRRLRKRMRKLRNQMIDILVFAIYFVFAVNHTYISAILPPIVPDHRFVLENCGTEYTGGLQAEHLFRFTSEQLYYLVDALRIPAVMFTPERDKYYAIEGICIVLRRMVFPVRYMDMVQLFGRQTGPLSRINLHMMAWLYARWGHLNDFNAAQVNNTIND